MTGTWSLATPAFTMEFDLINAGMLGVVFSVNVIFLIFNIVLLTMFFSILTKLRKQFESFHKDYGDKLIAANEEAEKIIHDSSTKAEDMLKHVDLDTSEIKAELKAILDNSAKQYSQEVNKSVKEINDEYNSFLKGLKTQMKSDTQGMVDQVLDVTKQEIDAFTGTMKKGTVEAQAMFEKKLHEEFSKALTNIDTYRKDQLSLIERSINRIIIKVTKNILGEAVSVTDHEKLIFDSLEKAKKEEIFEGIIKIGD